MSSKEPTPVSGSDSSKGKPEGVTNPGGREEGGESGGGSYPNPHRGKDGDSSASGFMGHGGQTTIDYHGSGQASNDGPEAPNAATRDEDDAAGARKGGAKPGPSGPHQDRVAEQTRQEALGGRSVEVFETSGVAAAEASGMTGVEGQEKTSPEHPGSG